MSHQPSPETARQLAHQARLSNLVAQMQYTPEYQELQRAEGTFLRVVAGLLQKAEQNSNEQRTRIQLLEQENRELRARLDAMRKQSKEVQF